MVIDYLIVDLIAQRPVDHIVIDLTDNKWIVVTDLVIIRHCDITGKILNQVQDIHTFSGRGRYILCFFVIQVACHVLVV